jgi:hypothetical protein
VTRQTVRRSLGHEMRTPIRSETEAFRLAVAAGLAVGVAVLIGWLTEVAIGVGAFALALAVGLIAYLRAANQDRGQPLRRAAHAQHPHGASPGKRHVLVVANDALSGSGLRDRILGNDHEHVEVDVLAPILASHLHQGVSDIDRELEDARDRLHRSLAWAREQGIVARGEVGDPSVTSAIEDELRDFSADEVIVVTQPAARETRQERDEIERLRRELEVPVTQIVVAEKIDLPKEASEESR